MSNELSKSYDPAAVEAEATRVWLAEKCFAADPSAPGEPYTIVIPPPNVTGALHLGHAINSTLQDILIRVHRMRGFNTLWIPGIDHAGIATQAVVEKQLKEKENKTRHDIGREELVNRIWAWKEQYGKRILEQLSRLGASCDWDRTRFTLDDMCARAVRETFFKLFKDGLIYRGKRLVNWDTHLQTSISDDEIYHETVKTSLWHIKYPIDGTDKFMIVATTRPETMLGDTAVAVHSEDSRWNWAIGKRVRLPLTDRLIPIIADDILVDPTFGSGVVKVTPAHDPNDYAVWQRHHMRADQINLINILNPDGTINSAGGPNYAGMKRELARKKVVEDLVALGLLEKEEPYETQVGHSDRSKTPIEPYLSDQWFVKMAPLAEPALEVVRNGSIKFHPERHAQQYLAWLGEKRDWPVSRQLWWGHRIPVWRQVRSPAERYLNQDLMGWWRSEAKSSSSQVAVCEDPADDSNLLICLRDSHSGTEGMLREHGFEQDPDVLNTWFSSALWPHSTLGWPAQTPELAKYYPTNVLVTGRDIITLWVARMVMMGMYNMGSRNVIREDVKRDNADSSHVSRFTFQSDSSAISHEQAAALGLPFLNVAINPTILDGKGERMSKSKGNGVDPVEIIETHGADALRFTLTMMATETQDARLPVKKDAQGRNTSEKFDLGRNFATKLWNAAKFAMANLASTAPTQSSVLSPQSLPERWIVSRFNRAVEEANTALAIYRFDQYATVCYDFFWRDFCDWYVEAIKPSLKNDSTAGPAAEVLAAVLDGMLRLMHPMIPFITETIWWKLNEVRPQRGLAGKIDCPVSPRLIKSSWPAVGVFDASAETTFPKLQEIIKAIRNARNDYKADPKKPLAVSINAPAEMTSVIAENRSIIELLAVCTIKELRADLTPPPNTAKASGAGCDLFIDGLVDEGAEEQRQAKRREELTRLIGAMEARLANPGYIAKAPPHLVDQTKQQLAELKAELEKLK